MSQIPRTSLEQWAVLQTVIEAGGFAQAAERLNRSQSSVSYAVARLRERVGIDLIRIDGRKACLTPAGLALLNDAVPLLEDMLRLEARARTVARGVEVEMTILIDSIFPRSALFAALRDMQQEYPDTEIHLHTASRVSVAQAMEQRRNVAVVMWDPTTPPTEWTVDIELVPVARADHPLAATAEALGPASVALHPVATITGSGASAYAARHPAVRSRQWQASSVESAIDMVDSGLCWGWLPAHMVDVDGSDARLVRLRLAFAEARIIRLCLVLADPVAAGSATRALSTLLRTHVEGHLRRSA